MLRPREPVLHSQEFVPRHALDWLASEQERPRVRFRGPAVRLVWIRQLTCGRIVLRRDLERLRQQVDEGIMAGSDKLHIRPVQPEPLSLD